MSKNLMCRKDKIMRHIFVMLLVGILILGSLGADGSSINKCDEYSQTLNDEAYTSVFNGEIELEITGGFGVHLIIRNIGDTDAFGVEFDVSIAGGILGMIHGHYDGIILSISFGSEFSLDIPILGFGPIEITATVEENTITAKGFVMFFFVFILS